LGNLPLRSLLLTASFLGLLPQGGALLAQLALLFQKLSAQGLLACNLNSKIKNGNGVCSGG
jgi:hypothetical protein